MYKQGAKHGNTDQYLAQAPELGVCVTLYALSIYILSFSFLTNWDRKKMVAIL